jgi:hypothetical protein
MRLGRRVRTSAVLPDGAPPKANGASAAIPGALDVGPRLTPINSGPLRWREALGTAWPAC